MALNVRSSARAREWKNRRVNRRSQEQNPVRKPHSPGPIGEDIHDPECGLPRKPNRRTSENSTSRQLDE
jgi:hypothetical protein